MYVEFQGFRPKIGVNHEEWDTLMGEEVNGTPTWARGSRLGPKCVTVNYGDLKGHENQKSELFMEKT